jgi:hypothetical protein
VGARVTRRKEIDRRFPEIGRLKLSSGTSDAATFKRINAMLTMLHQKGRIDVLRALQAKIVTPLDVWDRYRTNRLDKLATVETVMPLYPALESFRAALSGADSRHSLRGTINALQRLATAPTVADTPTLLARYRKDAELAQTASMFNNARKNLQAYLRATLGADHPLYVQTRAIAPLHVRRQTSRPFTRVTLPDFLRAMDVVHGPGTAQTARSLALSGMRPVEYWGDGWSSDGFTATVQTAKQRNGAVKIRKVPLVEPITRPACSRDSFERRMRKVTRDHVMYDLRRTFMHLMEQAGIPRSRRMSYLGHGPADVSALYEEHEVAEYLALDRARLAAYLNLPAQVTAP